MKEIITKDGLEELERELQERKTVTRVEIANEIEKAREQGDLSENAAYKAAMAKKEMNEIQISKLEDKIQNSEVTEAINGKSKIGLGSKAKVQNITLSQEYTFEIVGQTEADPAVGRISVGSPLGIAMAGKRHGETFKFKTPGGEHIYKVLEII